MTRYLFLALIAVLTLNTGCKLIYKQNVQQGNAHEQEDLDQVTLGMTKKQVAYLLGTPAVQDPFHKDRWDYISMLSRRGGEPVRRLVTLTFENDVLIATDGIGDSKGGDIKALEETKTAVAEINELQQNADVSVEAAAIVYARKKGIDVSAEADEALCSSVTLAATVKVLSVTTPTTNLTSRLPTGK